MLIMQVIKNSKFPFYLANAVRVLNEKKTNEKSFLIYLQETGDRKKEIKKER